MATSHYLSDGQETTGPFPLEELQRRHAAGELAATALIHDGQSWVPAAEFLRTKAIASNPDLALAQALAAEPKTDRADERARWESLLFLLSFPVLIPSLAFMWLTAKRWGHIDIYLIVVDGLVLTVITSFMSPWLGGVMLVAWIASVFLYWLRRDRQRLGIFLGYSNLVCLPLIFGGTLAIGGLIAVWPWKAYARLQTIQRAPIVVPVARTENQAVPFERTLVLSDEQLDLENTVLRQKVGGQWKFVLRRDQERTRFSPDQVRSVWQKIGPLAGHEIELTDVVLAGFSIIRDSVVLAEGPSKRTLAVPQHTFALVENSDARLWIVSARAPAPGATIRGVLHAINQDSATGAAYAAAKRGNLPLLVGAVFADEQAAPAKPELQEIWVPTKKSGGAFWIRFPDGVEPPTDAAARGIYVGELHEFPGLSDVAAKLFSHTDGRVLLQQPPAVYLAEQHVLENIWAGFAWKQTGWLAAGVALMALASWRARHE